MLGQGLIPKQYNPLADTLSSEDVSDYLKNLRTIIDTTVSGMPGYPDFLARLAA